MDFFLFLFLALIVAATAVLLVVMFYIGKIVRMVKKFMRGEMSEEDFQRMSNKYYYQQQEKQGPQFAKDYFKSRSSEQKDNKQKTRQQQANTTKTKDGNTIVDNREPSNKKIFAQDEGEYVEYTEV